jgi:transcriptional regulator with XRE-family HTH domain
LGVGENIKKLRKEKGLLQSDLAKKAGISRVAIGNYERDERTPNIEVINSIARALEVSMYELLEPNICFSKELIKALELPILQKFESTDALVVLSSQLGIDNNDLIRVTNENIELPTLYQIKLLKYLHTIDTNKYLDFCQNNLHYIMSSKQLGLFYQQSIDDKIIEPEDNSFYLFKSYITTTFGENVNELDGNGLYEVWKHINKVLEFELHKLKN